MFEDLVDESKVMFLGCRGERLLCLLVRLFLLPYLESIEVGDKFSQILMGDIGDQTIFEEGQEGGINLPLVIDVERSL